jgi:Zn-dependent M28 family amino/carboxypeptidase
MTKQLIAAVLLAGALFSCSKKKPAEEKPSVATVNAPQFMADSAYQYVYRQVEFGPRIPNSAAHAQAADYFVKTFKQHGATVVVQEFDAVTFDGTKLKLKNIIASHQPQIQKRVLLAAHWDTRPFADKDPEAPDARIDGADDGASGVGVLLELSRLLQMQKPNTGVDFILFDGEDWGEKSGQNTVPLPEGIDDWWCLGSQHWSTNKHKPGYKAYYGILLDMVGARNARFFREGISMEYAPKIVEKVWSTASSLGYDQYFIFQNSGPLVDDHKFINIDAGIPTIDIINYDPIRNVFGDHHHTRKDNMEVISKETLKAVGQTVTHVIYSEP